MSTHYRIREFAKLAGVTVKALHHYDRLGLLRPDRTQAGYRVYRERDLETLEQIVALKFLGLSLKEIGAVLKRPALKLPDTLRLQREALEERHELLGKAIRAIRSAEAAIASGETADLTVLKNIIEVIDMSDGVTVMKKYYSEETWEKHRRYYEEGPSREWLDFYRDAGELLGEDLASQKAQALGARWYELARRGHEGDPEALTDSPQAWMDRAQWPAAIKERAAELRMEEVDRFVKEAVLLWSKPRFSEQAWSRLLELRRQPGEEHTAQWKERVELFRDIEAALVEDPASQIAQALVARWKEQRKRFAGGDPEIEAAMRAGWAHRKNWPEAHRWQVERLHMMSFDRFEKAADFLDAAAAVADSPREEEKPMGLRAALAAEFDEEMSATGRMLERVPDDKFGWKPHEKSMTLGRLANHVAALPAVAEVVIRRRGSMPKDAASTAELLATLDRNAASGKEAIASLTEMQLAGDVMVTPEIRKPMWEVLRGRGLMNHLIHHRGQLSVYLRMLGVAVPGMYGPSADEKPPAPE
ncbi:MAG TPA: DinB family protein [Bryobacteraceae bacterium]|nr:DinB family protein [Bryobacteraceae bacterium]